MIAMLSDVHGNLEALQAVFADLKARGASRAFFLGDLVGYGPNPVECLDFIRHFEFCLLGNHDRAVVHGIPNNFNLVARHAALWTRERLNPDNMGLRFLRGGEHRHRKELWEFLQGLKPSRLLGGRLFAHDNPLNPGDDKYVRSQNRARVSFDKYPQVKTFFIGHSHIPRIFTYDEEMIPEPGRRYAIGNGRRYIINVGSVGQPRDKDPRACYVGLEPDSFRFYRVPYDVEATMKRIRQSELADSLADRLALGK